jgi:hypothetical protein
MASASTPLNHLRRDEQQDPASQKMMESIVQDLEGGAYSDYGDQEDMMNQQQQGDPRMQVDPRQEHFQPHPEQFQGDPQMYHGPSPREAWMQQMQQRQNQLEKKGFSEVILSEAKEPLLVSILVIILSSSHVQSLLSRFLPMADNSPLTGLLIRAALAGILFYLLRRFIPN